MALNIVKDSVDVGIVVRDADKALAFYRDTLGLTPDPLPEMPMPGGGVMYRFLAGKSGIKLVSLAHVPDAQNPPGGIGGASGFRYFTISVSNLDEATAAAEAAGYTIAVSPRDIREGIRISMIEDPDGNWVELLQIG